MKRARIIFTALNLLVSIVFIAEGIAAGVQLVYLGITSSILAAASLISAKDFSKYLYSASSAMIISSSLSLAYIAAQNSPIYPSQLNLVIQLAGIIAAIILIAITLIALQSGW